GFRPSLDKGAGSLTFSLADGRFKDFCEKANEAESDEPFVFIIDEFNRGNVAKIFGELMYLLEYRQKGESITLPYSGKSFFVPENVYIIGTMNTADRSLAIMDFALRRRFAFLRFDPDYEVLRVFLNKLDKADLADHLLKMLDTVNNKIPDKDFRIGISYFMKRNLDIKLAERVWKFEIEPYLEELFHNDQNLVKGLTWEHLNRNV
ncbi:MAG TPA: hypothetical protein DCE14_04690, partial [Kosmotogaceae bacterium]|nr:hypothetical protein [Kosmotogaceae bacterium]